MKRISYCQWAVGATCFALTLFGHCLTVSGQHVANSLAELRNYGVTANNSTVTLSSNHGDPHPVTGTVTPGEYWINGDHIANPTSTHPRFLELSGNGNTYDLSGATINLDTRELDGFGRNLGHDSGVDVVRISGSNNTVLGLTLIGQDIALDTDPNAQRFADWSTLYVELSGDNNTVDGAYVVSRGSRTDSYGLSDAFGKGASQGISPYILHRKASNFRVGEATNAVVNDVHLETYSFGHGFFVQFSTNTTLTNSTVTGELFPSSLVVDHPLYLQYGHTWWGEPIPDNIMLAGAEGGVRVYTGASGLTVDNVLVTNMRTGFATVHDGGNVNISNSYAFGTTSGFDVGDNTTITNCGGDIVNGPLLVFYGSFAGDSTIELEVFGGDPVGVNWSAAYLNGDNVDLTLTSELSANELPDQSMVRLGQSFFENWRNFDYNFATPEDGDPIPLTNSIFTNDTNQILVLGENAIGNFGSSLAPVVTNGKENYYDGISLVPTGKRTVVVHTAGLGNNGTSTNGSLEANASIVESDATLELQPGIRISDEKLTISGDGVDGQGALYSDGDTGSAAPRFGSSSNNDESTIFLAGDASIGVGLAGKQMLVGRIQGTGNLTKTGLGSLSVEKSSTFLGDLTVAEGEVIARSGVVKNHLAVWPGASIVGIGDMLDTPDGVVQLDGTIDLNGRTNEGSLLSGTISLLGGYGNVTSTNPAHDSGGSLEIAGDIGVGVFHGTIDGRVDIVKSGDSTQSFTGDLSYSGTTTVTGGILQIKGSHTGGGSYLVGSGGQTATVEMDTSYILADRLILGENSRIVMQLDGTTRASLPTTGDPGIYSAMDTYEAILDGELEANFGFTPVDGDTFDLISLPIGQIFAGEFDDVTVTGLPAGIGAISEIVPGNGAIGDVFRIRILAAEVLIPELLTITDGNLPAGTATQLANSDNQDLSIRRDNSDVRSRTGFTVTTTTSIQSPSAVEITLEGSVFARTTVNQFIELFNYDSQSWEQLDLQNASRFIDSTVTIQATGDSSRFVEAGTGMIEARIRYESLNPRQKFTSNTDLVTWTITP